jgi:hypothetical protein
MTDVGQEPTVAKDSFRAFELNGAAEMASFA